ncbi:MAG TPA: hypothetical protein VK875_13370, partial [Euzebyales bacterium]|nr:hypothetical protein [Euzebyales bacterium]
MSQPTHSDATLTSHATPTSRTDATAATRGRSPHRLALLAGTWSGLTLLLALWWWVSGRYPFGPADPLSDGTLLATIPASPAIAVLAGAGVLGLAVAVVAAGILRRAASLGRPAGRAGTALVIGTAALYGVAFVLLAPGNTLLSFGGYAMATLGPVVLPVVLLAGARRSGAAAAAVGALLLIAVVAGITGIADGETVATWAAELWTGLAAVGPRLLTLLFLAAGGVAWLGLGGVVARVHAAGRSTPRWTRPDEAARWGRVATAIATLCALPYALVRATWLTPWPLALPAESVLTSAVRLQGLLLGVAAVAGAVLTTGLVARWGEVWPRWMPVLRGRPVPVAAAVVPATLVTVLL